MKQEKRYMVENSAGWELDLRRFFDPEKVDRSRRPVMMVPGYCMNSFILNYHPTGESMIGYLVEEGFEVWAANLRGQGDSRPLRRGGRKPYGFRDLGLVDLPAALDFVSRETESLAEKVDLAGMSLGAPVCYTYLAHHALDHSIGAMVAVGGPLRWNRVHPMVRELLRSPGLAGMVKIRGTRQMARLAIPLVQKFPRLLDLYMNPSIIDLSRADELVKTIDDPDPKLTKEIAFWIRDRDLIVQGRNVCHSLYSVEVPLMCIIAGQDGIVTPESALSVLDHIGSHEVEVLEVGSEKVPHAHADLFISEGADEKVFRPLAEWLKKVNQAEEEQGEESDAGACGS